MINSDKSTQVNISNALKGRATPIHLNIPHALFGISMHSAPPPHTHTIIMAMGCFWGVERLFWQQKGVCYTAVGYTAGYTKNPHYDEVCSGLTGHTEAVLIYYQPEHIPFDRLLQLFWEHHDPAQGMRQGHDHGTQYRSGIYTFTEEQTKLAICSQYAYQHALHQSGDLRPITTEILPAQPFYFAEEYHQQYLFKNPQGYCGLAGTGVCFPTQG
ncbi:MAG: peptide-methionine (S)-S-oxide reductase MsrA [Plesiomonas sp.]|uniref:peptide-methionine (S)-S-oxide reductase MsrA n=1 Tax=Plesiomonas sp. TaxID=2486279 RepID=UPI003F2D423F